MLTVRVPLTVRKPRGGRKLMIASASTTDRGSSAADTMLVKAVARRDDAAGADGAVPAGVGATGERSISGRAGLRRCLRSDWPRASIALYPEHEASTATRATA